MKVSSDLKVKGKRLGRTLQTPNPDYSLIRELSEAHERFFSRTKLCKGGIRRRSTVDGTIDWVQPNGLIKGTVTYPVPPYRYEKNQEWALAAGRVKCIQYTGHCGPNGFFWRDSSE